MSSENDNKMNHHFVMLVAQLQGAAWIHLGKVANPTTGKVERNLDLAHEAIEMLGMIEEKTRGNLEADEEKVLRELLQQLRLNYVSEKDRPEPVAGSAGTSAGAAADSDAAEPEKHEAPSKEEASETSSSAGSDSSASGSDSGPENAESDASGKPSGS